MGAAVRCDRPLLPSLGGLPAPCFALSSVRASEVVVIRIAGPGSRGSSLGSLRGAFLAGFRLSMAGDARFIRSAAWPGAEGTSPATREPGAPSGTKPGRCVGLLSRTAVEISWHVPFAAGAGGVVRDPSARIRYKSRAHRQSARRPCVPCMWGGEGCPSRTKRSVLSGARVRCGPVAEVTPLGDSRTIEARRRSRDRRRDRVRLRNRSSGSR